MNYIIFFSTYWGYVQGGINSFNYDLCMALGDVCRGKNTKIVCMPFYDPAHALVNAANNNNVEIYPLEKNKDRLSLHDDVKEIKKYLNNLPDSDHLFLIGHDVFTGDLVSFLADDLGDKATSVVIHHMDYEAYYAIKGDASTHDLDDKIGEQKNVLENAGHVVAVGPKLKASADLKASGLVSRVTPGIPVIQEWKEIPRLVAITFGRYDVRTDKLKQMGLAAKAFVKFVEEERDLSGQDATLKIFGIDNEKDRNSLQDVYRENANGYVNILTLPYKTDRESLYKELSQSNLSLMLSVHEGFGLVGFESIAAGVPLVLSKNSGLYEFLISQIDPTAFESYGIYPVDIRGTMDGSINDKDLSTVIEAIRQVRKRHPDFRQGVLKLRDLLRETFSWKHSAEEFLTILSSLLSEENEQKASPGTSTLNAEVPMRLAPTKDTLNKLFALSGNVCAFPGCNHPIFDEDFELVAHVCHIEAALPGGERFNKNSNNEYRRQIDNLVCLCLRHHVKTNDVLQFPVEKLREMKRAHEYQFTEAGRQQHIPRMTLDKVYEQEKRLSEQIFEKVKSTEIKVDQLLAINEQLSSYLTANLPPLEESPFKSEIETIISLRETAGAQITIEQFDKFRERNWEKLNPAERYRVLANTGICYLETGEEQKAADSFLDAHKFQPDLLRAKSLASLAFAIKGDHEQAHQMITATLAEDPNNADAYQALVHTLAAEGESLERLITQIPEDLRSHPEIAHAIGFVARGQGNLHDAVTWFQIALDNTGTPKVNALADLASSILETVDSTAFVLNGAIDQNSKNKAHLAIQYFDEALEETASTSAKQTRAHCYMNRGVAKKFIGDRRGALEDMQAGNLLLDDFSTARHLAIAALEYNAKEQLWSALDKMSRHAATAEEKNQAELFIGEMDIIEGRLEKGISILEALLEKELSGNEKDYVQNKLVDVYTRTGQLTKASDLIDKLSAAHPDAVKTYLTKAQFLLDTEKAEEALLSLQTAEQLINEDTGAPEILELANLYRHLSNHESEARLLETIVNLNIYSALTRQLLNAYFQAGEYEKLIKACLQLLEAVGPRDVATEFLSWAYEEIDDLTNAVKVLTEYLEVFPEDQLIQARLAFVYYRQTDKESLRQLLNSIDHLDSTLPMEVQYRLAKMYRYIGDENTFKRFAYEVRRTFYEVPGAHDTFLALSVPVEAPKEDAHEELTMSSETAAIIRSGEAVTAYVLEDKEPLFASRGEISPKSKLGQALLGKKSGDSFIIDQQEIHIVNIVDKFEYAASESIRLLTTRYITDAKAKKITLNQNEDGTPDMEAFFAPLKRDSAADQYIEKIYKQAKLPIGVVASLKHISAIRVWAHYISSPDLGIFTSGHFKEMPDAEDMLKAGKPLILDILTITTLSSLQALDDLLLLPNEKIVTQSTLEELYDLIHEQEQSSQTGSFTIGIVDGQYMRQVLTAENVQDQIKMLQKLADWIKTNCSVVPVTAALSLHAVEKKELYDRIGKSFVDTILTAKEKDGLLYAEDMLLRAFAAINYDVKGCATFMIYRWLKDKKLITNERYTEKVLHLIAMNYKAIPVDAEILYSAAIRSKFKLDVPLLPALDNLTALPGQGLDVLEAVKFFYKLYIEKTAVIVTGENADYLQNLVEATLDQLCKKYYKNWLQDSLIRVVDRIFQFIPIHRQQLLELLKTYFSAK